MNIFLRELRANLKSLIIWSFIVVLFVAVGFSKFSAYYENPELLAILDTMPAAMLEAFNLTSPCRKPRLCPKNWAPAIMPPWGFPRSLMPLSWWSPKRRGRLRPFTRGGSRKRRKEMMWRQDSHSIGKEPVLIRFLS